MNNACIVNAVLAGVVAGNNVLRNGVSRPSDYSSFSSSADTLAAYVDALFPIGSYTNAQCALVTSATTAEFSGRWQTLISPAGYVAMAADIRRQYLGVSVMPEPGANGYNVDSYGAVGDRVTDDSAAIEAAIAAAPAGSVLSGTPGKAYLITRGMLVNKPLVFRNLHLYMPDPSSVSWNIPTISVSTAAMIMVWGGSSRAIVGGMVQSQGTDIDGCSFEWCTFESAGGIGTPYTALTQMLELYGTSNTQIVHCTFINGRSEVVLTDAYAGRIQFKNNVVLNCNHMGVSGVQWNGGSIAHNEFIDVWGSSELCPYNVFIHGNVTKTSSGGNNGWWLTDGSLGCKVRYQLWENVVHGDIKYPLLGTALVDPANLELCDVRSLDIECGALSGAGTHLLWFTMPSGGTLRLADITVDDAGCTVNAGAVVRIQGLAVPSTCIVDGLDITLSTNRLYSAIELDAGQLAPDTIRDLRVRGPGSFRAAASASLSAYSNVVLAGDPSVIANNLQSPRVFPTTVFVDSTVQPNVAVGDAAAIRMTAAKTVAGLGLTPGTLATLQADARIVLTHSASLACPGSVDYVVPAGETVRLQASLTGSAVQVIDSSVIDLVSELWPLQELPLVFLHADHRLIDDGGGNVVSWASLVGNYTLLVPGAGTAPTLGANWVDNRRTVTFGGVSSRLTTVIPAIFNGNDTPISLFVAYANNTTGVMAAVSQEGSSANTAIRMYSAAATDIRAQRVEGGVVNTATRSPASSPPAVCSASLSSAGIMRILEGSTAVTTDMSALGALANQTQFTLGDIYSGGSALPYAGSIRAVILAKGLTLAMQDTVAARLAAML